MWYYAQMINHSLNMHFLILDMFLSVIPRPDDSASLKYLEKNCETIINRKVRKGRTDIDSGSHHTSLRYSVKKKKSLDI